ncbi:MAG: hypothetical protein FJW85_07330 [Actinobacteria bacterium]|nr:hypothetical protein [Actinomycetota bacterium]
MHILTRPSRSPVPVSLLAVTLGVVGLLLPVVTAAPAQANIKVKSQYCGTINTVDTSIPTPSAATDVKARKYGLIKGKAKVFWSPPAGLKGYHLWWQIATSGGECTKAADSSDLSRVVTGVPSGSTEFQVVYWYANKGTPGPASYSAWSNAVNVK